MAVFNSTKRKFPKMFDEGKVWFNHIDVQSEEIISSSYVYILNDQFNYIEFYTDNQNRYFNKQLTWVWFKCHLSQECCMRIITETELSNIVERYAIKTHDKDDSLPHTHVIIKFYRSQRISKLLDYFHCDSVSDCSNNIKARWNYLIHNSETCRKENKFQYDIKDVLTNSFEFFDKLSDNSTVKVEAISVIEDILNGKTERYLISTYGMTYVIHRKAFHISAHMVSYEDVNSDVLKPLTRDEEFELLESEKAVRDKIKHCYDNQL